MPPWAWSGRSPKPSKLGSGPLSVVQVSWAAPKFKATYYYSIHPLIFVGYSHVGTLNSAYWAFSTFQSAFISAIALVVLWNSFLGWPCAHLALLAQRQKNTDVQCLLLSISMGRLSLNRSWNLYPISLWKMERVSLLAPTLSSTLPVIRVVPLGMWATSRTSLKDCREDGSTRRAGVTTGVASTCWAVHSRWPSRHLSRLVHFTSPPSFLPSSNR